MAEDIGWSYQPVSDLCPDVYPDSDYSDYGSSEKLSKYHGNPDDQEQEEVVSVTCRNPRSIRRCDQRTISHLKSEI